VSASASVSVSTSVSTSVSASVSALVSASAPVSVSAPAYVAAYGAANVAVPVLRRSVPVVNVPRSRTQQGVNRVAKGRQEGARGGCLVPV
jgi:hypothetical protein